MHGVWRMWEDSWVDGVIYQGVASIAFICVVAVYGRRGDDNGSWV